MNVITTVTQKGQVTLPKGFRDRLGIQPYDRVRVRATKNQILIEPTEDILDLAGSFVPKTKKPVMKAREAMEKRYRRF